MRSVIIFDIYYYKGYNIIELRQSRETTYHYFLRNHGARTTTGSVKFHEVTRDEIMEIDFSNYDYLELTPKGSILIRSIRHYV